MLLLWSRLARPILSSKAGSAASVESAQSRAESLASALHGPRCCVSLTLDPARSAAEVAPVFVCRSPTALSYFQFQDFARAHLGNCRQRILLSHSAQKCQRENKSAESV